MKQILLAGLVGAVLGAAVIWYRFPRHEIQVKTDTKTVTEYKVRTVEKIVERPDGSKETVKTVVDNTKQVTKESSVAQVAKKHDWSLGVSLGSQIGEFTPVYGFRLEKRIVGPVFAGIYGTTNKEAGISLGLEF